MLVQTVGPTGVSNFMVSKYIFGKVFQEGATEWRVLPQPPLYLRPGPAYHRTDFVSIIMSSVSYPACQQYIRLIPPFIAFRKLFRHKW